MSVNKAVLGCLHPKSLSEIHVYATGKNSSGDIWNAYEMFHERNPSVWISKFFFFFLSQFFKVIYNTVFSLKFLTSLGCVLLAEGLTAKTWDSCGRWSVLHSARKPSAAYAESGRHFLECKQPPCLIFLLKMGQRGVFWKDCVFI